MARLTFNDLKGHRKSKYNAKWVEYQGWKFPSQLECDFYKYLQFLKQAGAVKLILRQVPLFLAPDSKLVVDFVIEHLDSRGLQWYDTKGIMTSTARTKIKVAEHLYGIQIHIIKRGDF